MFESLWFDEAFTLAVSKLDMQRLAPALAGDVHPPAWYVIEWLTVRILGTSALALRLPALICGLLAIWLAALVFDAMPFYYRLEPIALAGMVLSPFLAYHATEARMYNLVLVMVLLGTLAALRQNYFIFGLALAGGLLSHNLFVLYIPALIALYLIYDRRYLAVLQSLVIAGLVYSPWLPIAYGQVVSHDDYWILVPGPGHLVYMLVEIVAGYSLTDSLTVLIVTIFSLVLLILGTIEAGKKRAWELLSLAYTPLIVGLVLSYIVKPVLIARVLIGIAPFVLVLLAWGGWLLYQQAGPWLIGAGAAAALVCLSSLYLNSPRYDFAGEYARLDIRPGDQCFHLSPASQVYASAYLPQCYHRTWSDAPHKSNGLSQMTIEALGLELGPYTGQRWIFETTEPHTDPAEVDYLNNILAGHQASKFTLRQTDFVESAVWRIDD